MAKYIVETEKIETSFVQYEVEADSEDEARKSYMLKRFVVDEIVDYNSTKEVVKQVYTKEEFYGS